MHIRSASLQTKRGGLLSVFSSVTFVPAGLDRSIKCIPRLKKSIESITRLDTVFARVGAVNCARTCVLFVEGGGMEKLLNIKVKGRFNERTTS